jgi:hypothetical protein
VPIAKSMVSQPWLLVVECRNARESMDEEANKAFFYPTVSKNRDVMKNTCLGIAFWRRQKAQSATKCGSVVPYVTKRVLFCTSFVEVSSLRSSVAGWNAVLRAC